MRNPIGLVLDCADPERLAAFWVEALGYEKVGAAGSYLLLVDGDGAGPQLLLQAVPEGNVSEERVGSEVNQ